MSAGEGFGFGGFETCPECGSEELVVVSDGEQTNFFCSSCARCWHVSLGWVRRVDPMTCAGCAQRWACRGAVTGRHVATASTPTR